MLRWMDMGLLMVIMLRSAWKALRSLQLLELCVYTDKNIRIRIRVHVYECVYSAMYMCMYVCMYVCMHACMYVCK